MSIPRYHLVSTVLASATQRSLCLPIGHSFNLLRCPKLSAFGAEAHHHRREMQTEQTKEDWCSIKIYYLSSYPIYSSSTHRQLLFITTAILILTNDTLSHPLRLQNAHSTPPSLSGDLINWLQCIVNYTAERPLLSEFYPVYWFPFTARLDQTSVTETPSVVVVVCKDVTGWWWFVLLGRLW